MISSGARVIDGHCNLLHSQLTTNKVNAMRETADALVADVKTLARQAQELRQAVFEIE